MCVGALLGTRNEDLCWESTLEQLPTSLVRNATRFMARRLTSTNTELKQLVYAVMGKEEQEILQTHGRLWFGLKRIWLDVGLTTDEAELLE